MTHTQTEILNDEMSKLEYYTAMIIDDKDHITKLKMVMWVKQYNRAMAVFEAFDKLGFLSDIEVIRIKCKINACCAYITTVKECNKIHTVVYKDGREI